MEIRTKHEISDKVWYIEKTNIQNEYIWRVITCFGKWEIYGFRIFNDGIYCVLFEENYRNKFNFETDYNHKEQDCFATEEEAQKECDKRNGKENNSRV